MAKSPTINRSDVELLPLTYEQIIPEDYMDLMNHMNVMWYTHLFSMAIMKVFGIIGLTREYMEEHHSGMFALESHIRYLSEVRVDQQVSVYSRFLGSSSKRMHLIHFLVNHDKHDVAATFELITSHVDMRTRRTSPFPDDLTARIEALVQEHATLPWEAPLCGAMHA